jgi:hypothetical protein
MMSMTTLKHRALRCLLVATLFCVASSFVTLTPTAAYAQDATVSRIEKLLAQAMEDYDVLEIDSSEQKLKKAVELADAEGVDHPVMARVWIMVGIVRFAATRDEGVAEIAFTEALKYDRTAEIPAVYKTPDLDTIMGEVRDALPPEEAPEGPTAGGVAEITHKPLQTADAGKPLNFRVEVPSDMPVYSVVVYIRRFNETDFGIFELKPTSATVFAGDLAAKEVRTSQIDYYIEAKDRGGKVIAKIASNEVPYNIVVLGSGDVADNGSGGGSDLTDGDRDGEGDGDGDGDGDTETPSTSDTIMYVNLGVGTGGGFIAGEATSTVFGSSVNPGVAPAFGHAMIDIGATITDSAHIGLFFRFQFAPTQDLSATPPEDTSFPTTDQECLGLGLPGDCILGLKYKWFFSNSDSLRLYSTFGSGVGRVRNWVQVKQRATSPSCAGKEILSDTDSNGNPVDVCFVRDTVRNGWLHFGLGGGVGIPITDNIDFLIDTYLMVLVPETAINLDATAGFGFRF